LRFHTATPPAAAVTEFALASGVALVLDAQAKVRAYDLGTGTLLYQHVAANYQRSLFPAGADLVLALSQGCDGGAPSGCLASVDPKTGVSRGQWPHSGNLLWREGGKALFASRDATYQRTIVALDESSHQFTDVSSSYAGLLAEFNGMPTLDFSQLAGPTTEGAVYLDGRVFSSPGGKLCRFEVATQKKTWCIDGQDLKIRLHPNALYAWSSVPGTYPGVYSPSTGATLASQNGFSLFFGHWGFGDAKMLEVH
jgi:hypothetical protein